jgi:hypothetical protein
MSNVALLISVDDKQIAEIHNRFANTNCQSMPSLRPMLHIYSLGIMPHSVRLDPDSDSNTFSFLIIILVFYNWVSYDQAPYQAWSLVGFVLQWALVPCKN